MFQLVPFGSGNSRLRGNFFLLRKSASCRPEINPNVNPALKNFSARRFAPEDKFLEGLPLLLIAINIKVIENRINELENKFQKQKEQNFFYLIKKHLKELSAKKIAELIIAFVLGFLLGNFF